MSHTCNTIGEYPRNARTRLTLFGVQLALLAGGCVAHSRVTLKRGVPLDQNAIQRIEIGKSTRSEVFKLMGTPHSMFQGQVELKQAQFTGMGFYRHLENRFLTTLDDEHYAMLYRFDKSSTKSTIVLVVDFTNISIQTDELLLLLNRKTDVVDDVAYRKETSESREAGK
jgi:hypothetical protein